MHPSLRMVASGLVSGLVSGLLSGACFDFDATMAGGPLVDAGGDALTDASVTDSPQSDGPVDASVDATDGGPVEASGVTDSGTPTGPYCESLTPPDAGLFFCDDFDEHPLPGSWNTWVETAGSMTETDASAVSPPNSVDESTIQLANGQVVNVALRTSFNPVPAVPVTLTFAFEVEPVQIDPAAGAAIILGAIDFLDGSGDRYTVGLAVNVANGLPALALGEQSGVVSGGNFPDGGPEHAAAHEQVVPGRRRDRLGRHEHRRQGHHRRHAGAGRAAHDDRRADVAADRRGDELRHHVRRRAVSGVGGAVRQRALHGAVSRIVVNPIPALRRVSPPTRPSPHSDGGKGRGWGASRLQCDQA